MNPIPPRGVKAWGGWPPEARGNLQCRGTPDQICAEASTDSQMWPQQLKKRCKNASRYLSYVPPAHKCGTRPFLRWVRSQGWIPHASGMAKNTFDPIGIALIRGASGTRQWIQPPKGGKSLGGRPPEAGGKSPVSRHIQPDLCWSEHGLPNVTKHLERRRKNASLSSRLRQDLNNRTKMPYSGQSHNVVTYMRASM